MTTIERPSTAVEGISERVTGKRFAPAGDATCQWGHVPAELRVPSPPAGLPTRKRRTEDDST